ncbi:MAG TPA: phage portal protein [Puia sp.]
MDAIIKQTPPIDHETYAKQYDSEQHEIVTRPDKTVETDAGPSQVTVTKVTINDQQRIVNSAVAFLCGKPIRLSANAAQQVEKDLLQVLQKTWDDNKLFYVNQKLARLMMSETECAEIWYSVPCSPDYWANTPMEGAKARFRVKILAYSLADTLCPVYDRYGDMVAFGRGYKITVGDKSEEHFDLYTETKTYMGVNQANTWTVTQENVPAGKIGIMYYSQPRPEWWPSQRAITRRELVVSGHGDSNDYFGSPMIIVEGKILSFSKKGEQGKVLEIEAGGKVSTLAWPQAPESLKLELENLKALVNDQTDTPDIGFDTMKGLGAVASGTALKFFFMKPHMKAARNEETHGEIVQRRINYLKAALIKLSPKLEKAATLSIRPLYEYFLPKNDQEIVTNLSTATGGRPTMSQETAVKINPYVKDPETELIKIKEEGVDPIMDPLNT